MTTIYHIDIESVSGDDELSDANRHRQLASAFGDLDTMSYIAKKAVKEIEGADGSFSLVLDEVNGFGGTTIRKVVALTADADVVVTVLKGKLTSERKAGKTAAEEGLGEKTEAPVTEELDGLTAEKYHAGF
jgi:hypothetical protein